MGSMAPGRHHGRPRALALLPIVIGVAYAVSPAGAQLTEQAADTAVDTGSAGHGQPMPLPTQTSFAQSQLRYARVTQL